MNLSGNIMNNFLKYLYLYQYAIAIIIFAGSLALIFSSLKKFADFYNSCFWIKPKIILPRKRLMYYLFIFSLVEYFLITLALSIMNILIVITWFFMGILIYLYFSLIKVWRLFKYSIIHIIAINIFIIALSVLTVFLFNGNFIFRTTFF